MDSLLRFRAWGIRRKIFFAVLASVIFSIGITSLVNYLRISRDLFTTAGEKLLTLNETTSNYVTAQIDNQVNALKAIAVSSIFKDEIELSNLAYGKLSEEEINRGISIADQAWINHEPSADTLINAINTNHTSQQLKEMQSAYQADVEIFVTDQRGAIVAMTNRTSDYWQADESWWQTTIQGDIYCSSPIHDESSDTWAIVIGVPVFKDEISSEVIGVVRGTVDITAVLNSIFTLNSRETGQGVFISQDRFMYYLNNGVLEIDPMPERYGTYLTSKAKFWKDGTTDLNGDPAILSFTTLSGRETPIGWVMVSLDKQEITKLLLSTLQENIIIATLLIILMGLFSIVLANSILRSLDLLKHDTELMASGNYHTAFSKQIRRSHDADIASLVDSFTRMRDAVQERERELSNNEKKYRALVETMSEGLVMVNQQGKIVYVNPHMAEMIGYSQQDALGQSFYQFFPEERHENVRVHWAISLKSYQNSYESYLLCRDQTLMPVVISTQLQIEDDGRISGVLAVVTDITARKKSELAMRKRLNELAALRKIDLTILEKSTLRDVIQTVLVQIKNQIKADAAAIYVFENHTTAVQKNAAYGPGESNITYDVTIHSELLEQYSHLTEGVFFQRNIQRRRVHACNEENQFKVLYVAPILSNDGIRGVVEMAYLQDVVLDEEWYSFFDGLVTQLAVGINKIELMDHLRERNVALHQAYDGAIGGWAKALELRDEETKGHSDRVVDLALQVASAFGFKDKDLENFRIGSLLHDIGKMGIPDNILLKPGKLTEAEWVIMRKHPVYAYELLTQIPFLRDAVEIPYFHHERWDGSGYPLGLKGEDIPLSARIFAVVDVWDALTNDRPYRKAWSKEETAKYLLDNAGILFDENIVKYFLQTVYDPAG